MMLTKTGPLTLSCLTVCKRKRREEKRSGQSHIIFGGFTHSFYVDTYQLGGSKLHDFEAFTPTVANIRPTSKGEINIKSKDSRENPKIKMNYLSTNEDRKVAAEGLKIIRKIMLETETFKKYEPEEYRPGIDIDDNEELVKAGSDYTQTIFTL